MAVRPDHRLTYEDYAAFPDDGIRRELVDGEVYVTPSAITRHQNLVGRVFLALAKHVEQFGGGQVFVAPYDVLLSDNDVVQPDVVFVDDSRLDVITSKHIRGAPTLAVEILSDPRHDRVRKRALYERAGIPWYWILDGDADRVEVHRLSDGRYGAPTIVEPPATLTLDALPGFALDLAALFLR